MPWFIRSIWFLVLSSVFSMALWARPVEIPVGLTCCSQMDRGLSFDYDEPHEDVFVYDGANVRIASECASQLAGPRLLFDAFAEFLAAEGAIAGEGSLFSELPGATGVQVPGRLTPAQMAALTEEHGVEFSLVYRTGPGVNGGGGTYWLYSGTENSVMVPVAQDVHWIYHTHPGGTLFGSQADLDVLSALRSAGSPQNTTQIVPIGGTTFRFGP